MAWRFKASKYKNANPVTPKPENIIRDLNLGSYRSQGNFIAASASFMAFNWDIQGANLAVLPLDAKGRQNRQKMALLRASAETITDFKFSPFDDGLLATGSQDAEVKLWRIKDHENLPQSAELSLPRSPRRVETVDFHPAADHILASTSAEELQIWDIQMGSSLYKFEDHGDQVQSVSWHYDRGHLIATQCKDKTLRILDPRMRKVATACGSHHGLKDSRVVWVQNDRLLTTGFSQSRLREINIRDLRNLNEPEKNLTLDMSSGILVPLFDPDTNMCFLSGKGDRNIQFVEITNREPFVIEGLTFSGQGQTKGACLVPKRAMQVMQGEVNRVLQMCDSSIVPVTWQVPRKSYREYHADIYPETRGVEAAMGPQDWFEDKLDVLPDKIDLNPKMRSGEKADLVRIREQKLADSPSKKEPKVVKNGSGNGSNGHSNNGHTAQSDATETDQVSARSSFVKPNPKPRASFTAGACVEPAVPKPSPRSNNGHNNGGSFEDTNNQEDSLVMLKRQPSIRDRKKMYEERVKKSQQEEKNSSNSNKSDEENKENKILKNNPFMTSAKQQPAAAAEGEPPQNKPKKAPKKIFGRISKFKHLKGEVMLKGKFENLKNLSRTCPAECDFIHANPKYIFLPLTGNGGRLAVFDTAKPGRINDGVLPVLINAATVMDFALDPFDDRRLAVGCDDGQVRLWVIKELVKPNNEPDCIFTAHSDKVQIAQFHPLAKDVLLTAGFDRSVKLWNVEDNEEDRKQPLIELLGHEDTLFSAKFSQCGRFLSTLCRDGKIRIYQPRTSNKPIKESSRGGVIVPKKGARVLWVLEGKYLLVTGFSRQSEREISLFQTDSDLNEPVNKITLDVSPAVLIPFYDEDSNTLFLTGKGESSVTTFEVAEDFPHLFPLSPYRSGSGLHQGLSFLPKNILNVKEVEFARAFRVTDNNIEPVSFTVPRVRTNFFQDDLFPPTRVLWEPAMGAVGWFGGAEKEARRISLRPEGMLNLSGTQVADNNGSSRPSSVRTATGEPKKDVKEQAADLENAVSDFIGKEVSEKLEQDKFEGVEDKEWDEE